MRIVISLFVFLSFALPLNASETMNFVCLPFKTAYAPAFSKTDMNSMSICDFERDQYFDGITASKPQFAKISCDIRDGERAFKLRISSHSLELADETNSTKFLRHDHDDGITGIALSDGQYQEILVFAPETKKMSYAKLNPFAGVTTFIGKCY